METFEYVVERFNLSNAKPEEIEKQLNDSCKSGWVLDHTQMADDYLWLFYKKPAEVEDTSPKEIPVTHD